MSPLKVYDAVGALSAATKAAGDYAKLAAEGDETNTYRDVALCHLADLRRHANRLEDALAAKPLAAPSLGSAEWLGLSALSVQPMGVAA